MASSDEHNELIGRLLAAQQQNIDLRARLDREHQAGEGFLRLSERALTVENLASFWELAAEETVSTFGAENALLVCLEGETPLLCATCCADAVTSAELNALAAFAQRTVAARTAFVDAGELPPIAGRATALLLVAGFTDRGDDGRAYALIASVSVAKRPFYPPFDAALGPLFAAFANHLAAVQQHIRGRVETRRITLQLQRLAEVANRTGNSVIIADLEGRIIWVNDSFERLTGWTLAEVVGGSPGSFLQGPGTDPDCRRHMRAAIRSRLPFEVEVANYSRSGKQYWVHIQTRVTYDERGEATGFVAVETDVTERRIAALREGLAQRIASVLLASSSLELASRDLVAELVGELDEIGVRSAQLWAVEPRNDSLAYIAGDALPSTGEAGRAFLDATRALPFRRGDAPGAGVGAPGTAWSTERVCFQMLLVVNGVPSRRFDEATAVGIDGLCAAPIVGPDGVLGVLEVGGARAFPGFELLPTILERVAEQMAAFMLHDRSRRAFRQIFEQSPDGMLLVDADGRVQTANARAQALFGPVIDRQLDGLLDAGAALVRAALEAPAGDEAPTQLFHRAARGHDGHEFSAEISVAATPKSSTQAAIIAVRDLTERHHMEASLTQSLREKETLLKEIHHRVKNNLQIISSLLMLQADKMPSEQGRSRLEESVHRVRSMALIHEQLYGSDSLERIELGTYARQLAESLRGALAPSARVRVNAAPVEVTVEQAVPIGLILNELLTNAFKYGVRGRESRESREPRADDVVIELARADTEVTLEVRDFGPGIPASFDPARSTSLGLQLVRTLTRQLRGKLTFTSEGGAAFRLVFVVRGAVAGASLRPPSM